MSSTVSNKEQAEFDRIDDLCAALNRPMYVWRMASARREAGLRNETAESDPHMRGALTQMRDAALEIDVIVREYGRQQ